MRLLLPFALLALLCGCLSSPGTTTESTIMPATAVSSTPTTILPQTTISLPEIVKQKLAECDAKKLQSTRFTCYLDIATAIRSPEICSLLKNNVDDCTMLLSIQLQNSTICGQVKLQEKRDQCFTRLATTFNDTSMCETVADQSYREFCYYGIAWRLNDSALCELIRNDTHREICYNKTGRPVD